MKGGEGEKKGVTVCVRVRNAGGYRRREGCKKGRK